MATLLVLATGGTIASAPSSDGLTPQLTPEALIEAVPSLASRATLIVQEIMAIDSTNVHPHDWQTMARAITPHLSDVDGVVVTHGTDTLAYTAAALSFLLAPLSCPVVLTGSQRTLSEPNSDAPKNLDDAVTVALSGLKGVFVVFHGRVLLGNHTAKHHTTDEDAFQSVNAPDIGRVDNQRFKILTPPPTLAPLELSTTTPERYPLDDRVALITLTPGLKAAWLDALLKTDITGIVLDAFGCGGAPTYDETHNVIHALARARDRGQMVLVTSQPPFGPTILSRYAVGRALEQVGAWSTGWMTREASVVKLMWALGQSHDRAIVKRLIDHDVAGEHWHG